MRIFRAKNKPMISLLNEERERERENGMQAGRENILNIFLDNCQILCTKKTIS